LYKMATNNAINNASPNIAAHSLMLSQAASAQTGLLLAAGQIPIGTTSSDPSGAALTAGTGISINSASGAVTISSTGVGSLTWNDVSGTTQAAAVNNGYIISNAGQTTVTIGATVAEGSVFAVQGKGAGGWILAMNTGQTCHFGNSATSSGGSLTSTNLWDSVAIVCVTANTTFAVTTSQGNLTVA
jgi:hypothetical protein